MRSFFLIVGLPALLGAQDARQIMVRAVEMYHKDAEIARNYTFLQREVESDLDSSGKPKSTEIRTWDVTLQEGSPYRRLVARNDKPISPEEQKQEADKLQWSIEQRRKETPEQRELRIANWRRREQRRSEPVKDLPNAFDFQFVREQALNGGETWVIDATPKPGYKPKSTATSFFPKVKIRFWIDKREYQCVRAEMETEETVTFGGFLVRVAKGGHLMLEQTRVNDEVWLPKRFTMEASARLMLVKAYHKALDMTFSEYKKFQTDSRVVSMGPGLK
ncbi:MAG TPA: hypothetical protein VGZ73_27160 [Bryobacteraceae bacterium]|nr:hypothetical protein [Bryobacteraceae bacterium]